MNGNYDGLTRSSQRKRTRLVAVRARFLCTKRQTVASLPTSNAVCSRGECERNQFRRRSAAPRTQRLLFVFEFFEDISGQGSPPHRQPASLATRVAQN